MAVPRLSVEGAGASEIALSVQGLEVGYSGATALRGVSLALPKGSTVALLGANGAGKTTTIRAIMGMLNLYRGSILAGEVRINGDVVTGLGSHVVAKHRVALVPEGRMIFPTLSIEDNLLAGTTARRTAGKAETMESVYDMFPILKERRRSDAGLLSGGEQQMLSIGRALMADPAIILLDEVSLGLAPIITRSLFETLWRIHRERGVSLLVVEQNANLALEFCDHAYILENGRVVHEGAAATLRDDPQIQELYLGGAEGEAEALAGPRQERTRRWIS